MANQDFELFLLDKLREAGFALLKEKAPELTLANISRLLGTPLGRDLGDVRVADLFRADLPSPGGARSPDPPQCDRSSSPTTGAEGVRSMPAPGGEMSPIHSIINNARKWLAARPTRQERNRTKACITVRALDVFQVDLSSPPHANICAHHERVEKILDRVVQEMHNEGVSLSISLILNDGSQLSQVAPLPTAGDVTEQYLMTFADVHSAVLDRLECARDELMSFAKTTPFFSDGGRKWRSGTLELPFAVPIPCGHVITIREVCRRDDGANIGAPLVADLDSNVRYCRSDLLKWLHGTALLLDPRSGYEAVGELRNARVTFTNVGAHPDGTFTTHLSLDAVGT